MDVYSKNMFQIKKIVYLIIMIKKIENIEKSLSILLKMNFTLRINIVGQMMLKVLPYIDINDEMEYQCIISKICDSVLKLPDYVKTNSSTVAITFSLLDMISQGKTQDMIDQDLSYAYAMSTQLARNESTDKKAFKVLSNYI